MADETVKTNGAGTNHGGGVLSRDAAYRKTAAHFEAALQVWVDSLSSRNEAIRLGAANKIIDKCLPDIKATELTGPEGGELIIKIVKDEFKPKPDESGDTFSDTKLSGAATDISE